MNKAKCLQFFLPNKQSKFFARYSTIRQSRVVTFVRFSWGQQGWGFCCRLDVVIKSDPKWMLLLNDCYKTVSGHSLALSMFIFHKTEVQRVSLRCLTDLNPDLLKSYDTKSKYFHFRFFCNFVENSSNGFSALLIFFAF